MDSLGNIYVGDNCGVRMINSTGNENFVSLFKLKFKKILSKINYLTFPIDENLKIGYVSFIAGAISTCGQADGNFTAARFNYIFGIYFDSANNQLLISDYTNNRVKVLDFNCKIPFMFRMKKKSKS